MKEIRCLIFVVNMPQVYKRYQDWANQYPRILPVFEISDIGGEKLK